MKSIYYDPGAKEEGNKRKWFKNVKLIGEIHDGTSIYIEDYAYTYLYQYANSDLSHELCAVLIGDHYKESNQLVIFGVILVEDRLVETDAQWIDKGIMDRIEEQRRIYYPEGKCVGWMHTQPGYGIMSTIKELAVHKEMFTQEDVLMLIDPIYKAEAFFTCHKDKFLQVKGYCIYYEKNELMQKYMEANPVLEEKPQQVNDKVVGDFRELGARRKKEIERKKKRNKFIAVAVGSTLLITAFVTGIYSQQRKINALKKEMVNNQQQYQPSRGDIHNNPVEIIFTSAPKETELKADKDQQEELELRQVAAQETETQEIETQEIETTKTQEKSEAEQKETLEETPKLPQAKYEIHTVEMGDSLLSISYNYYKTVAMAKEIADLNNIIDQDTIYIGQKLKLPKTRS